MNKAYFWSGFISGVVFFIFFSIVIYKKIFVQSNILVNYIEIIDSNKNNIDLITLIENKQIKNIRTAL